MRLFTNLLFRPRHQPLCNVTRAEVVATGSKHALEMYELCMKHNSLFDQAALDFAVKQESAQATPKVKLSFPNIERPARHHHFKPYSRHIATDTITYRCRCGAYYAQGPCGWKASDPSPYPRSCK